jgi:hypothetical protein
MHVGQGVLVKKERKNMDNEKEITFQVGGYHHYPKWKNIFCYLKF